MSKAELPKTQSGNTYTYVKLYWSAKTAKMLIANPVYDRVPLMSTALLTKGLY